MKHLLLTISLLLAVFGYSQQVIKMCENNNTSFTYISDCNVAGVYTWTVDGGVQASTAQTMNVDWTEYDYGIHTVEVSFVSVTNCEAEPTTFTVTTLECANSTLYAPNSFTPDGSEPNNVWLPKGYNWKEIHYTIYNRWGEVIFESYDGTVGWDGTYKGRPCQVDTYVYHIDWKDNLNHRHQEYGHINLIK